MKNIFIGLCLTMFSGLGSNFTDAVAAVGDNPRIDRNIELGTHERDSLATERLSSKVQFIAGTAELTDADYIKLYEYFSAVTADGEHRKITIAVWPDMVGEQVIDENQLDLINSRISEITAILVDQGYTGDIETRNMATTMVDPNADPELRTPAPSSAVILIESTAPHTSLSH